jgi:hypothetical protein
MNENVEARIAAAKLAGLEGPFCPTCGNHDLKVFWIKTPKLVERVSALQYVCQECISWAGRLTYRPDPEDIFLVLAVDWDIGTAWERYLVWKDRNARYALHG